VSRAVVILVGLLAVGLACSASNLDGRLLSLTHFGHDPLAVYEQLLVDVGYSLSGWRFGFHGELVGNQIPLVAFDAEGSVGPVDGYSIVLFRPYLVGTASEDGTFAAWNSVGTLSLGGLNLYAISVASNYAHFDGNLEWAPGEVGIGLRLGGWSTIGRVKAFVETRFNVQNYVYLPLPTTLCYWELGFEAFVSAHRGVVEWGDAYGLPFWHLTTPSRYMMPQTTGCALPWQGAEVFLAIPVACHDVALYARINAHMGFDRAEAFIEDVGLGLGWLELGYALVGFTTTDKRVDLTFALNVTDTTCVTPYFALETSNRWTLDGIGLAALTFEHEIGSGVIVKAGEKFTDTHWDHFVGWTEQHWSGWTAWGEIEPYDTHLWLYGWDGVFYPGYEEYIAIEVNGEACCGGSIDAFVYAWFDTDQTAAFMDWAETIVGIRVGVGSNTRLMLNVYLDEGGLDGVVLGAEAIW